MREGPTIQISQSIRLASALLAAGIPTLIVGSYNLHHFYVFGGYVWDSGLFAYFTTESTTWPMNWPPFQHHDPQIGPPPFFGTHFMPVFYLTSLLSMGIPGAAAFSFLVALSTGIIGASTFSLCSQDGRTSVALVAAISTALCGPILAALGFPHIELLIPALILAFFALRAAGHGKSAILALTLCLLVREDAGLHAASLLILSAIAKWTSAIRKDEASRDLFTGLACVAYSIGALAYIRIGFPGVHQLENIYLGNPVGSHLSWKLIMDRAQLFLTGKAYATWPVFLLIAAALLLRDPILAVGPIAVVPWIAISLLAVGDAALTSYYAFPIVLAIAWPSVGRYHADRAAMQTVISVSSIVLFAVLATNNHDNKPWLRMSPPDLGNIGSFERKLAAMVEKRAILGRLMVDDAVASLVPSSLLNNEWVAQWERDRLPDPDTVIFSEKSWSRDSAMKAITAVGLELRCRIEGTPFIVASRKVLDWSGLDCDPIASKD